MSPTEFFEEVVRPNLDELDAHFGDRRRALNAIASIDALASHLFEWCRANCPAEVAGIKRDSAYRERLAGQSADFRLLRDLAKAVKHAKLDDGDPLVRSAGAVHVARLLWGNGNWDEMRWDSPSQVVAETKDGNCRAVDALTKRVAEFFEQEMRRLGVPCSPRTMNHVHQAR